MRSTGRCLPELESSVHGSNWEFVPKLMPSPSSFCEVIALSDALQSAALDRGAADRRRLPGLSSVLVPTW